MAKRSKGRRKINMEKIENESNLQVTFSKRRAGLFKKGSELSTLCGAEMAMVVFSPGNKVFSFGNPSVEAVVDRYLSRNPPSEDIMDQLVGAQRDAKARELNKNLTFVEGILDVEKKRAETIRQVMENDSYNQYWFTRPQNDLGWEQLDVLGGLMQVMSQSVRKAVGVVSAQAVNGVPPGPGPVPVPGVPYAATPLAFGGDAVGGNFVVGGASGAGTSAMVPYGGDSGSAMVPYGGASGSGTSAMVPYGFNYGSGPGGFF